MFSKYWWLSSPLLDSQPSPAQRGVLGGQQATPLSCFQAKVGQLPPFQKASRCHHSHPGQACTWEHQTQLATSWFPLLLLKVPVSSGGPDGTRQVPGHAALCEVVLLHSYCQAERGVPVKQRDKVVFRTSSFCGRRACSSFPSCTSWFICKYFAFRRSSLVSV